MSDGEQATQRDKASDKHAQAMEKYRALDLQLDDRGVVQLSTDAVRRLFAYGYFAEGYAPKHIESWKHVDEGIQMLQGMGCPALSNLEFLYFVQGKMTAMHRLCLAACEGTGELEKNKVTWVDAQNKQVDESNVVGFEAAACVVRVRRRGRADDAVGFFTTDDAKKMGLMDRNKIWQKNTKDMLYHRASMRALAQQFADVLQGVRCKEIEELQPMLDEQGQPLKNADGSQLFQRRLARLRESEQAFGKLKA